MYSLRQKIINSILDMIQILKLIMYVCIEVALRGDAHGKGRSEWTKGKDPSGSWVQYHALTHYCVCSVTTFTLGS